MNPKLTACKIHIINKLLVVISIPGIRSMASNVIIVTSFYPNANIKTLKTTSKI